MKATFVLLLAAIALADRGTFMHITDTHIKLDYKEGSDPSSGCWKGSGSAGKYGDYECRSPITVHKAAYALVEKQNKTIDFVLFTGDTAAEIDGSYTKDGIKTMLEAKTGLFKDFQKKTGAKIFPMLGNHDSVPQHDMSEEDWWVYGVAADLWKEYLTEDAYASFKKYGRYVQDINDNMRLLVVNSVLYYLYNDEVHSSTKDPAGQFAWIKEQLAKARADGKFVYAAGHIAPGRINDVDVDETWADKFSSAFDGYHDILKGSFWGHYHTHTFHFLGDVDGNNYSVSHITPNMGADVDRNPVFQLFDFERTNGDILDYHLFSFDLDKANAEDKTTWSKSYSATEFFGIDDCKPASLYKAWTKLKDDRSLFKKFYMYTYGDMERNPGDEKRAKKLCTIICPLKADYEKCLDNI